jgi:predicted nuclease of predicted toxin-antitoxin system
MAQLFADENFPLPVVEALRHLGHDVLTLAESGNAGQKIPDVTVLAIATEANRILMTLNRKHFIRLHAENTNHAGIVVCTFNPDFAGQANQIHTTLEEEPDMAGQLIRVNRLIG